MRVVDETGNEHGMLRVLRRAEKPATIKSSKKSAYWECQCVCGALTIVKGSALRKKEVISCGCANRLFKQLSDSELQRRVTAPRVCKRCKCLKPPDQYQVDSRGSRRIPRIVCRDCYRESTSRYQQIHHLREKYNITPEVVEAMRRAQNNLCAICRTFLVNPHVDHNKATGKVRGLLCLGCNTGLGSFKENIEALSAAIAYKRNEGFSS